LLKVLVCSSSFGKSPRLRWLDHVSSTYSITFLQHPTSVSARTVSMDLSLQQTLIKMQMCEEHPEFDAWIWLDSILSLRHEHAIDMLLDSCQGSQACFIEHDSRSSVTEELSHLVGSHSDSLVLNSQVQSYLEDKTYNDNILLRSDVFVVARIDRTPGISSCSW